MKPELTYEMIFNIIDKENKKIKKKEKHIKTFGVTIFGILAAIAGLGGFFIWFQFDLFGPKHLSFLGILWGIIWGATTIIFATQYWGKREKENPRYFLDYYDVIEDTVYDIRCNKKNENERYFSFVELSQYHNYGYIKIPDRYKKVNPGDRFFIIIDQLRGDVIFICRNTEYTISFRDDEFDPEDIDRLYFVSTEDFVFGNYASQRGIELNDENSNRKMFLN